MRADTTNFFLMTGSALIGGGFVYLLNQFVGGDWTVWQTAILGGFMSILAYRFLLGCYSTGVAITTKQLKSLAVNFLILGIFLWVFLSEWTWTKGVIVLILLIGLGLWEGFKRKK